MIREQEKFLHLGLITAGNASKKALAAQQQPYQKNPKKQYPKKYVPKPNKGLKQFQPQTEIVTHQNDKAYKNKGKKTIDIATFAIMMAI